MIRKDIRERILHYFFINPAAKLRVREIERKLNIPIPSIIRHCKELEEEGFLRVVAIGSTRFYTANRTSKKYILEKKLYNIRTLYECGLVDFIKMKFSNPTIILFGSYSKGEDNEKSDVDLYIETPSKQEVSFKKFEKMLSRKLHILKCKSIFEIKNKNLSNNIINGIPLNGYIKVFK